MPLITDGPDDLNQGTETVAPSCVFSASAGSATTITDTGNLPALAATEFFEIRDSSVAGNNGLYQVTTVTTSTTEYILKKISGIDPINAGSESLSTFGATGAASEKSVYFDTATKLVYLLEQGNMDTAGVTMLALHSFMKARWKDDQYLMDTAEFPMVGISFAAGQWIFGQDPSGNNSGWKPAEDDATNSIYTRQLIRNAGWDEVNITGNATKKYFNVTTLGDFNAAGDQAHYRFGSDATDLAAAVDYVYTDKVNEPVKYFEEFSGIDTFTYVDGAGGEDTVTRATGSFITDGFQVGGQMTTRASNTPANDGTYTITGVAALTLNFATASFNTGEIDATAEVAADNSNAFTTFLRIEAKTFGAANLANAGETAISSKIIKFPLANNADVDVTKADPVTGTLVGNGNYEDIEIRYFDQAYNREVDSATNRDFGIVIDVGTHSGVDGSAPGAASVLTTAEAGMTASAFVGGNLRIHEGTDENTDFPITANTASTITVTGTIASATDISFTAQLATPIVATRNEIYERVQYQLRQAADVDDTDQVINGKTTDALLAFVGADLKIGDGIPTNPNGGGSGVIIEGFDSNDTNNLYFTDNVGTEYTYPFVAAGTFTFSQTLVDDTDGEYWLYFDRTVRTSSVNVVTANNTGSSMDIVHADLPVYVVGDYLRIGGFADADNNGLFIVVTENVSSSDYEVRKVDGTAVGVAADTGTILVDEHPYPSPDALIVQNNDGPTNLAADINSTSIGFNFDYDNNSQGGRTTGVANVVLVAAGAEAAQVAVVKGLQITRATGLAFSITSPLERNYLDEV